LPMNEEYKICPKCSAVNAPAARECVRCRQQLNIIQAASSPVKVECPVCKIPMYPGTLAGFEIYHCAECGSTCYKKESLTRMMPQDEKTFTRGDAERGHVRPPYFEKRERPPFLICPYCRKKMESRKTGPMQADICAECSAVFLDSGKEKHLSEMLGPYKSFIMNRGSKNTGRHSR